MSYQPSVSGGSIPYVPHNAVWKPNRRGLVCDTPVVRTFRITERVTSLARMRLISKLHSESNGVQPGYPAAIGPSRMAHDGGKYRTHTTFMPVIYGSKQNIHTNVLKDIARVHTARRGHSCLNRKRKESIMHANEEQSRAVSAMSWKDIAFNREPKYAMDYPNGPDPELSDCISNDDDDLDIFTDPGSSNDSSLGSVEASDEEQPSSNENFNKDQNPKLKYFCENFGVREDALNGILTEQAWKTHVDHKCTSRGKDLIETEEHHCFNILNVYKSDKQTPKLVNTGNHMIAKPRLQNRTCNNSPTPSSCSIPQSVGDNRGFSSKSMCSCNQNKCSALPVVVVKIKDGNEDGNAIKRSTEIKDGASHNMERPITEQKITPATASPYDIDKEHVDMMKQALHAYREHTEKHYKSHQARRVIRPRSAHTSHLPGAQTRAVQPRPESAHTTALPLQTSKPGQNAETLSYSRPSSGHTTPTMVQVQPTTETDSMVSHKSSCDNATVEGETPSPVVCASPRFRTNSHSRQNSPQITPRLCNSNQTNLRKERPISASIMDMERHSRPTSAYTTSPVNRRPTSACTFTKIGGSSGHSMVVHPRPDSPNARLAIIMPGVTSAQAKQQYTRAHRPHSGNRTTKKHTMSKSLDHIATGKSNSTPSVIEKTSPSHPQFTMHSPRIRTASYTDNGGMNIDSDVISVVGMANSVPSERPAKDTVKKQVPSKQKIATNQTVGRQANSTDKEHKEKSPKKNYQGTCFVSPRKVKQPCYTIHPEWVSESFSVKGVSLQAKRTDYGRTNSPSPYMEQRRCKSAPPSRSRNPITWENW